MDDPLRAEQAQAAVVARPQWPGALRALRAAGSVSQAEWAVLLNVSRSTVARWERGAAAPSAEVEAAMIALCEARGLFRRYDHGPLAGVTLTPALLCDLLADARLATGAGGTGSSVRSRSGASPSQVRHAGTPRSAVDERARVARGVLPTGAVTFLFTDIEESTTRWEHVTEAMDAALQRHDALVRAVIEMHGGHVFKTVGDAFYCAFSSATAAVAAAVAVQRALQAEPWGAVGSLRVRTALHTGEARARDRDYFGPTINRVARLLAAAYGEQILLSQAVAERVRDELPAGVRLRDLGEHRLKDLIHPEHIYQVVAPDLPADFPPLKVSDVPRTNLPTAVTSFVGRTNELAEVQTLLDGTRLLTLTGSGGVGKTRLALEAARAVVPAFPHGVWLIELAALSDCALMAQAFARSVGVREQPGRSVVEVLEAWAGEKTALLVLDNCEHVVAAAAVLVERLLRAGPGLHILATSRETLGLTGERVWTVPSLTLPRPAPGAQARQDVIDGLLRFDAVRLFVERAMAAAPGFAFMPAVAPAVVEICQRLDGIPLALELAAARVRVLSVDGVAARLGDCFRLLTSGSRTALPRQQTLRATIDWSYDLLDDEERATFERLSVFAGGATVAAVAAVLFGDEAADLETLDRLARLVNRSLVMVDEQSDEPRYRMLETIRAYGLEKLAASGHEAGVRARFMDWCVAVAERAEPQLAGPRQKQWLDRLEEEHDNLRAALAWSLEDEAENGLRIAAAIGHFWAVRGYLAEGRRWLDRLLDRARTVAPHWRVKALNVSGNLARMQGDSAHEQALHEACLNLSRASGDLKGTALSLTNLGYAATVAGDLFRATDLYEEALTLWRELGDRRGIASSLNALALTVARQGDHTHATALLQESLTLRQQMGDTQGVALALSNLGIFASRAGDHRGAMALHEQSLALRRELGDRRGIAESLGNLAVTAERRGDDAEAAARYAECLAVSRELDDRRSIARALTNVARVGTRRHEYDQVLAWYDEALVLHRETGDMLGIAACLDGVAALACARGDARRAGMLCGAAAMLRSTGQQAPLEERDAHEAVVRSVRDALREDDFAAAEAAGRSFSLDAALALARFGHTKG